MLDKTKVVLLTIIAVLLAIILYFIYIQVKLAHVVPQPTTVTSATSQPTTTITSMISSSLPQSQQTLPLIISQSVNSADWQITLPLITDKWAVVVSPTTSNQYFSAYLSMTGKVDDTAIEIVSPTVIPNTSLLTTSANFSQYAGYPYLIINSSAPFTVYIGFAKE